MKKIMVIVFMVALVIASVSMGTFAAYNTNFTFDENGAVHAKDFVFIGEGSDSFSDVIKIAPMETIDNIFTFSNYQDDIVSTVNMDVVINLTISAIPGKQEIQNLLVQVKDEQENVVGTGGVENGVGTIIVETSFGFEPEIKTYNVEISWPSQENDIEYAGDSFGNIIAISATATQCQDGEINEGGSGGIITPDDGNSGGEGGNSGGEGEGNGGDNPSVQYAGNASGQNNLATDVIADNGFVSNVRHQQSKELQAAVYDYNGNSFKALTSDESGLSSLLGSQQFYWKPVVTSNGGVLLAASNVNTTSRSNVANCPVVYYNGQYYSWYSQKYGCKSKYITDDGFDPSELNNPAVTDSIGSVWTVVTP